MLLLQMEYAEDRLRTMYCEAAKNVHCCRPNMEGYTNSVAAVPADEILRGQSFIHGESPGVAVRTGRHAHSPVSILKDPSMPRPERMSSLFFLGGVGGGSSRANLFMHKLDL